MSLVGVAVSRLASEDLLTNSRENGGLGLNQCKMQLRSRLKNKTIKTFEKEKPDGVEREVISEREPYNLRQRKSRDQNEIAKYASTNVKQENKSISEKSVAKKKKNDQLRFNKKSSPLTAASLARSPLSLTSSGFDRQDDLIVEEVDEIGEENDAVRGADFWMRPRPALLNSPSLNSLGSEASEASQNSQNSNSTVGTASALSLMVDLDIESESGFLKNSEQIDSDQRSQVSETFGDDSRVEKGGNCKRKRSKNNSRRQSHRRNSVARKKERRGSIKRATFPVTNGVAPTDELLDRIGSCMEIDNEQDGEELSNEDTDVNLAENQATEDEFKSEVGTNDLSSNNFPLVCLICMESFTEVDPPMAIPCKNRCNQAPVHPKCIYEWRESHSDKDAAPCPLCRSYLNKLDYVPQDTINSAKFGDLFVRRSFLLNPVPKEAGYVRFFVRVRTGAFETEENPSKGTLLENNVYELYLQAPTTLKYPLGPVPDGKSPREGDQLLAFVNRMSFTKEMWKNYKYEHRVSQLNVFMSKEAAALPGNFVAGIKSSYGGFRHEIFVPDLDALAQRRKEHTARIREILKERARAGESKERLKTKEYIGSVSDEIREERLVKMNRTSEISMMFKEACCIQYVQNRARSCAGPRKIQVCLPPLDTSETKLEQVQSLSEQPEQSSLVSKYNGDDNLSKDESHQNMSLSRILSERLALGTDAESLQKHSPTESTNSDSKSEPKAQINSKGFIFARNKDPYWLESINAYSLDFKGRVTWPSNKNFQLLIESDKEKIEEEKSNASAKDKENISNKEKKSFEAMIRDDSDADEIAVQFGKVGEAENFEVYSMDVKWPLSPLQAFGICLSACDRSGNPTFNRCPHNCVSHAHSHSQSHAHSHSHANPSVHGPAALNSSPTTQSEQGIASNNSNVNTDSNEIRGPRGGYFTRTSSTLLTNALHTTSVTTNSPRGNGNSVSSNELPIRRSRRGAITQSMFRNDS